MGIFVTFFNRVQACPMVSAVGLAAGESTRHLAIQVRFFNVFQSKGDFSLFSIPREDVPKFANPEEIPPHNLTSSLFSTWTCLTAHMWMTPP